MQNTVSGVTPRQTWIYTWGGVLERKLGSRCPAAGSFRRGRSDAYYCILVKYIVIIMCETIVNNNTSGGMEMSRRECTGVPDETV